MLSHADLARKAKTIYTGKPDIALAAEAQLFFAQAAGEFLVGCPGTHMDDILAWLRDFSAWPRWCGVIGLCHAGFGQGAQTLWPYVAARPELKTRVMPWEGRALAVSSPALVTYYGHSLGGALAQGLAGYHAAFLPHIPFRLVTFGAPRLVFVANWQARPLIHRALRAIAYQRAGDPVPEVPFKPVYGHRMACRKIGTPLPSGGDLLANHAIDLYIADLAQSGA